jgi:predicted DNA-binding protein (MmcQ/YjbR family)
MSPEAFHEAALALPGATYDVKWGADRIYSVGGKMFAGGGHIGDPAPKYAFKASDASFEMLVAEGVAIPAPYMARARWVQLTAFDSIPDEQMRAYLKQAHALTAEKLSKKLRVELGIG